MYKPYDKRFSKKPKASFIYRVRSFSLKYFCRKIKYRIKYRTDYDASWSLDYYSLEWLYYHLWRYLEDADSIVCLDQEIKIDGVCYTIKDACKTLMDKIEDTLYDEDIFYTEEYAKKLVDIFNFYGKLAFYLWY